MMQCCGEEIRTRGPMTAAELHTTLDDDVFTMAKTVFERIAFSLIAVKFEERAGRGNYPTRLPDGRYDLLPP